jgi:hypothetical protein
MCDIAPDISKEELDWRLFRYTAPDAVTKV